MRFILNFIFFGVLFYAIYVAFPDAFHTLVGWADKIYEFLRTLALQLLSKVQELTSSSSTSIIPTSPTQTIMMAISLFFNR